MKTNIKNLFKNKNFKGDVNMKILEKIGRVFGRKTDDEVIKLVNNAVEENKRILVKQSFLRTVDKKFNNLEKSGKKYVEPTEILKDKFGVHNGRFYAEAADQKFEDNADLIHKYQKRYTKINTKLGKSEEEINEHLRIYKKFTVEENEIRDNAIDNYTKALVVNIIANNSINFNINKTTKNFNEMINRDNIKDNFANQYLITKYYLKNALSFIGNTKVCKDDFYEFIMQLQF